MPICSLPNWTCRRSLYNQPIPIQSWFRYSCEMRVHWVWCYVNLPVGANILMLERNLTISACVGWTGAAGGFLYGEICWVSLGPRYDNELLFVIDGIKTKLITLSRLSRHPVCRGGAWQGDCGGEIIHNRHQLQLQLLPARLRCVGGWWGLAVATVSSPFPIVLVDFTTQCWQSVMTSGFWQRSHKTEIFGVEYPWRTVICLV